MEAGELLINSSGQHNVLISSNAQSHILPDYFQICHTFAQRNKHSSLSPPRIKLRHMNFILNHAQIRINSFKSARAEFIGKILASQIICQTLLSNFPFFLLNLNSHWPKAVFPPSFLCRLLRSELLNDYSLEPQCVAIFILWKNKNKNHTFSISTKLGMLSFSCSHNAYS